MLGEAARACLWHVPGRGAFRHPSEGGMLNGGKARAIQLDGRHYLMLAGLVCAYATLLLMLALQGGQEFGWPVALAVLVSPVFIGWGIPAMPVAWQKVRALISSIRGPHWIVALLVASCYIEQFFTAVGVRNAGDVGQNPLNSINLGGRGLSALHRVIALPTTL